MILPYVNPEEDSLRLGRHRANSRTGSEIHRAVAKTSSRLRNQTMDRAGY